MDARPSYAGPSYAGPSYAGPSYAGPNDAGPNGAGPNDAGPNDAGPRGAGPRDADVYRLIFDRAGAGIFQSTPEGRYLMVNPALAELLGCATVAEAMALDIPSLYVDPRRREEFKALVARDGQVRDFTLELRRVDGRRIWLSETATPVRDAAGRPVSYIGTLVDVTPQIEALQALCMAEREYRDLFEQSAIGMYRSSLDGRLLRTNPALARLNGYETEEELLATGMDIAGEWYVQPGRREIFALLLERSGHLEGFVSEVARHRTGERIWVSESARLVRDAAGQALYYEGTIQDITEQVVSREQLLAAQAEAEAASRSKSAFLANMSHELRTPLNAIIGFTEAMQAEVYGPVGSPRYRDYLEDVRTSGLHLLQLLEDILDLSKVEAGKMELRRTPVDLAEVVQEAARMLETLAARRAVCVEVRVERPGAEGLPRVLGDRRRLRQVALNLLSNAIKYNVRGGRVEACLSAESPAQGPPLPEGMLRLVVADTGIGIAEANLERVFEPFTQIGRELRESQEGSGLGLPLCRELVEMHSGRLAIDSRLGEGTWVTIDLPIAR